MDIRDQSGLKAALHVGNPENVSLFALFTPVHVFHGFASQGNGGGPPALGLPEIKSSNCCTMPGSQ